MVRNSVAVLSASQVLHTRKGKCLENTLGTLKIAIELCPRIRGLHDDGLLCLPQEALEQQVVAEAMVNESQNLSAIEMP